MLRYFQFSAFFQMFFMSSSSLLPLFWTEAWHYTPSEVAWLNSISIAIALVAPFYFGKGFRISTEKTILFLFAFIALAGAGLWGSGFFLYQVMIFAFLQFLRAGILTLVPTGVLHFLGPNSGHQYGTYRRVGSFGFLVGVVGAGYACQFFGAKWLPMLIIISAGLAALPFLNRIRIPQTDPTQGSYREVMRNPVLRPLLLGYTLISAWSAAVFTFMPLRLQEMGASSGLIGWTISLCGITALLSLVPIGKWIDRHSPAKLYQIVPLCAALRIFLMSLPDTNPYWFLLIQLLHIPTWVLGEAIQIKLIRQHSPSHLYSRAMALISIGLSAGVALTSALGGVFVHHIGLQGTFAIIAILPLLALPWTRKLLTNRIAAPNAP